MIFKDRQEAGEKLGYMLRRESYATKDSVVFALPRGGVECAVEVAKALAAPLGLLVVRKIGHRYNSEYAIGAVAADGCSELAYEAHEMQPEWLACAIKKERQEAARREKVYNHLLTPREVRWKTAIIVDDGLATGLTMLVAIKEVRQLQPRAIVVAVPVAAADTIHRISKEVDRVVAIHVPDNFFGAIGMYYALFEQVSDEGVIALLERYKHNSRAHFAEYNG